LITSPVARINALLANARIIKASLLAEQAYCAAFCTADELPRHYSSSPPPTLSEIEELYASLSGVLSDCEDRLQAAITLVLGSGEIGSAEHTAATTEFFAALRSLHARESLRVEGFCVGITRLRVGLRGGDC
jgi:hypothetical protein